MKKILMICYGGGHVKIIENIYNSLKDIEELTIDILALTAAQKYLQEKSIPYKNLEYYYNKSKDIKILKLGKLFIEELQLKYSDIESILYYGYSLNELYKKYGEKKIKEAYKQYGRMIFLPIDFAQKVLEIENPNLVLTTTSPRMEKAFLLAAKKKSISTVYVDDMLGIGVNTDVRIVKYLKDKDYLPSYGEYNFVSCEYAKKNLLRVTSNKVIVTGQPNFDKIYNFDKKLVKNLKINTKRKIITLLSQPYENQKEYLFQVFNILNKKNIFLILKKHPNENEDYVSLLKQFKNLQENSIILEDKLYESILKADLIINRNSTSGLEANILGKFVIGEKTKFLEHEALGIGWEYSNMEELDLLIDKFFIEESNLKINKIFDIENSSLKVKEEILRIINN